MFDRLESIESRYNEIERLLGDNTSLSDYSKVAALAQERADIEPIVEAYREHRRASRELADSRELVDAEADPDLRAMALEEVYSLETQIEAIETRLKTLLIPKDLRDEKNVILEVRAGTGGDEAGLFAADLLRMYSRYAEGRNWKVEVMDANESGIGGFASVTAHIKGKGVFSRLKFESGVHRVQRVPATESQGRIHTSTATVAVLAEMDAVDVQIDERDLEIDFYKSSGAGGQHVQKNETAVRLLHKPTGLVVTCQNERSQLQNKIQAMSILRARLYELEVERQRNEQDTARRSQIGTGERSEKIRTYNYPQNRITDHRIGKTVYNLTVVMEGELDEFIDELITRDQAEKLGGGVLSGVNAAADDDE